MFESWTVLFAGLAYVGLLFAVATFGDRLARQGGMPAPRPFIYALSLGVYCTSWTYFGSVGVASRSGWDFLPIYLGPVLVFVFGLRAAAGEPGLDRVEERHPTSLFRQKRRSYSELVSVGRGASDDRAGGAA